MKTLTFSVILIIGSLLFSACAEVIEVELEDAEPRIVIEGHLYDQLRPATVMLSRSAEFFGNPEFDLIEDAEVNIIDNQGNTAALESDSAGFYSADFNGVAGEKYTLQVLADGKEYTAEADLRQALSIDSLSVVSLRDEFNFDTDEYGIYCHFSNPSGQKDYMQFRIYKNFEPSFYLYLLDDFYIDGLNFDFFFWSDFMEENDTVIVEMLTMDSQVYEYLYTLSEVAGGGGTGTATPYNPTTNISNDALGYFGAFGLSGAVIIVQEGAVSTQKQSFEEMQAIRKRIHSNHKAAKILRQ